MQKIKENIYYVGAKDAERELFDALIPLPRGTSYNAYLILGKEKKALIDTVDPTKFTVLAEELEKVEKLDYIVANHAEQDHSGSIPMVLKKFPETKVLCSKVAKAMLQDLLQIEDSAIQTVEDGEILDLGGKSLKFIYTPWVHWPETMSTYIVEDKILFACDFFGSHEGNFELFVEDEKETYLSAKRYYAEIMMPFRMMVKSNMEKVKKEEISIIAPSHGPVYQKPKMILEAYNNWVSEETENEAVIVFVSMHGSTRAMVNYLSEEIRRQNREVKVFDLEKDEIGEILMALVEAKTVILGTPTVLAGAHPKVLDFAYLMKALKPKTKNFVLIGSYGWGGQTAQQVKSLVDNGKMKIWEPILIKGFPKEADLAQLKTLAQELGEN